MTSDPITPGSPLARSLDDFPVPPLNAGFADKVVAAAERRPAPLPQLRNTGGGRRWRFGRRIVIGAACFGALATAAAATGVLERFDLAVPSPEKVWASLTTTSASPPVATAPAASKPARSATAAIAPVKIDGPIDTPEELGEAFRRIDEVRQGRIEARRELAGQRIDRAIERRRAAGLPVPTPEQEVRLRQRIEEAQARRVRKADEQIAARRTQLERKVESGEALTREDFTGNRRSDPVAADRRERLKQLRQMAPEQRREAILTMPPEQRRAIADQFRKRRGAQVSDTPAPPMETPVPPADTAPQQTSPQE